MAAKTRSRLGALGTTSARVSATAVRVSTTAAHVVAVAGRKLRVMHTQKPAVSCKP